MREFNTKPSNGYYKKFNGRCCFKKFGKTCGIRAFGLVNSQKLCKMHYNDIMNKEKKLKSY